MEPKIRLKGFSGEWLETTFDSLAKIRRGLTYSPSNIIAKGIRVLRSSNINEDTFVTSEDDVFVEEECVNIPLANDGDILITAANGSPRLVGKHAVIKNNGSKMVPGGFMVLAMTDEPYFLNSCMSSPWYKKFLKIGVAGGNGAIGNLNKTALCDSVLFIPTNRVERDSIASYFQHLDSLIQSTTKKIESLKQVKAASLQSMFPQEGETVPRVRFKGFEGEWKQIVMSDVGYMTAGGTPSTFEDSYWNGDINWLQSGAVQNNIILPSAVERKITKEGLSNSAAHLVQKDSVLIAITGATCANIGYLTFNSTANQSVVSVEPYRGFDSKFVYQSLMINRNQILSFKGGSAQSGVTLSNLKKMSILCPDYQEQQKIGCFFFNIEEMIMQCMTRLEKLKQIKTACLDNMFV